MTSAVLNFSSLGTNKDCFLEKVFHFQSNFFLSILLPLQIGKREGGREKKDKGKKRKRSWGEEEIEEKRKRS